MFSMLDKKFNELLTCTNDERIEELLEYLKTSSYYCYKIIKHEPHVSYRDEIIQHAIDHFHIQNEWEDLRTIISHEQREKILSKLEYYPSYCYDLIRNKHYDSEYELNRLLNGLRKSIKYILDIFNYQSKSTLFLSLEHNLFLYQEIINHSSPRVLVDTLIKTKRIPELRELVFGEFMVNKELAQLIINDRQVLIDLKNDEQKVFYEKYGDDIFNKYKSTKVGYIEYCTSYKEHIGFKEKKLFIDKILKHKKGIEIQRHLNLLSYSGESKEYLDSILILSKLSERG